MYVLYNTRILAVDMGNEQKDVKCGGLEKPAGYLLIFGQANMFFIIKVNFINTLCDHRAAVEMSMMLFLHSIVIKIVKRIYEATAKDN